MMLCDPRSVWNITFWSPRKTNFPHLLWELRILLTALYV